MGDSGGLESSKDSSSPTAVQKPAEQPVKPRRMTEAVQPLAPCTFCAKHPDGIQSALTRPCDIFIAGKQIVECTNCANHRRTTSDENHACIIPPKNTLGLRRYADEDPISYGNATCDRCSSQQNGNGRCDVDPLLKLACSQCKNAACVLDATHMGPRPKVHQTQERWFRHSCSTCHNLSQGRKSSIQGCSWLHNRSSWRTACDQCADSDLLCLEGGIAVEYPTVRPPPSWQVSTQESHCLINVNNVGPWRKRCQPCEKQGEICRSSTLAPLNACNRCEARGVDCISTDGALYPIFNLGAVGYGRVNCFRACDRCLEAGRNCDRQRPCDSCVNHGEEECCTVISKGCLKDRFTAPPGPLYYLGLGYGALGVDDVKDGSRLEHWIGPPWPVYALKTDVSTEMQGLATRVIKARQLFLPEGQPPHGGPEGHLTHLQPSRMTVDDLVKALRAQWPHIKPPSEHIQGFDEHLRVARDHVNKTLEQSERNTRHRAVTTTSFATSPAASDSGAFDTTPTPFRQITPSPKIDPQLDTDMESARYRPWTEEDWDAWEASLAQYPWYADAIPFDFNALPSQPGPKIAAQSRGTQRGIWQHEPASRLGQAAGPNVFVSSPRPADAVAARLNTGPIPHHEQRQTIDNTPSMKVSEVIEYPGPAGKAVPLPKGQRVRVDRDPAIFESHKFSKQVTLGTSWMYYS